MTHQGHSLTTFTCGFTQPGGNDSAIPRAVAVNPLMRKTEASTASLPKLLMYRNTAHLVTKTTDGDK
jgi:hypothetical protein